MELTAAVDPFVGADDVDLLKQLMDSFWMSC